MSRIPGSPSVWEEPTRAVKKGKSPIPSSFPDPYTHQDATVHPFEEMFDQFSSELRARENWYSLIHDESFLTSWREEMEDNNLAYFCPRVQAEVQWIASLRDVEADPSPVDGVWMKDGLVSEALQKSVLEMASALETTQPASSKDMVVNLIDPSLHCYVHGVTRMNEDPNHSQLRDEEQWKSFLASGRVESNDTIQKCMEMIEGAKSVVDTALQEDEMDVDDDYDEYASGWTRESGMTRKGYIMQKKQEAQEKAKQLELERWLKEDKENQIHLPEDQSVCFDPRLLSKKHQPVDPHSPSAMTKYNEPKRRLIQHVASQFRWLPSDVSVDMFGKVQFDSYINGIHPFKNRVMYDTIAQVMTLFLPLWGCVLRDLTIRPLPHTLHRLDMSEIDEYEIAQGISPFYLEEEYRTYQAGLGMISDSDGEESDEEEMERNEEIMAKMRQKMENNGGLVDIFNELQPPPLPPPVDFARSSLKVVVKMISIELTPEQPHYQERYHMEGIPEEAILAVGIYCFAAENLMMESQIYFRLAMADPVDADVKDPMGLSSGCAMNRPLQPVPIKSGRMVAFPNIYQHMLFDVDLCDSTKPGCTKMLAFFLVDPNKNSQVLSTGQVPPVCQAWYDSDVSADVSTLQTPEQAHLYRDNLLRTRQLYGTSQNENLFERIGLFPEY